MIAWRCDESGSVGCGLLTFRGARCGRVDLMTWGVTGDGDLASSRCQTARRPAVSCRHLAQGIAHPDQVVHGGGEGEQPAHVSHSAMPRLPEQGHRLQHPKIFSTRFRTPLADHVPGA